MTGVSFYQTGGWWFLGHRCFASNNTVRPAREPSPEEIKPNIAKDRCVDSTTQQLIIPSSAEDAASAPLGIPIWHHGTLDRAQLTTVRHAVHLMRHLDDYHEPTLAALCRWQLRGLPQVSGAGGRVPGAGTSSPNTRHPIPDTQARSEARRVATSAFLAAPVHLASVRAIEDVLGQRLPLKDEGGRRKAEENCDCNARFIFHPSSFRGRHLPRGLHLVFSDQRHRRADRTADLWLAASTPERAAGSYYWASAVPPSYAARKRSDSLRLADAAAVWQYIAQQEEE